MTFILLFLLLLIRAGKIELEALPFYISHSSNNALILVEGR